ncbi:MAG: hypothetical protein EU548_04745 [Promethearchaeota archaeon]|nr:MAG: hypothetical protein EU548_04745 [Candidatus Lokiarchaeota archaeon]
MVVDIITNLHIVISSIQLTVTLLFVFLFYNEWRKQKRTKNEQYIPLALMIGYLLLSIGFFMLINSNYLFGSLYLDLLLEIGTYFNLMLGACIVVIGIFVFVAERILKIKHYFMIYLLAIGIAFFLLISLDIPYKFIIYIILVSPISILVFLFRFRLIKRTSGKIRQKMSIAVIGYTGAIISVLFIIQVILEKNPVIPLETKILTLISSIIFGYGFYTIPSFSEFDWETKIRHLYLLTPEGICLFQHSFKARSIRDDDLFGGSLMAIQNILKDMMQSDKNLSVIDHQDAKIIFKQSKSIIAIMVADQELYIVDRKLEQLLNEFELSFGEMMKDWSGNVSLFQSLKYNVSKIFELKETTPAQIK